MRFFACVWVMLFHFAGGNPSVDNGDLLQTIFFKIQSRGLYGVEIFFVISAFILTILSKGGEKDIIYHKFIQNRILRVFPLFLFCIAATVPIVGVLDSSQIMNMLLLNFSTGGYLNKALNMGVLWSIGVEFKFYLLFPFFMRFLKKDGCSQIVGMIGIIIFARILMLLYAKSGNFYGTFIGRIDQFLIGIILGKLYLQGFFNFLKNPLYNILSWIFVVLLYAFTMHYYVSMFPKTPYTVIKPTIQAISAAWLIITYLHSNLLSNKYIHSVLVYLGNLTFSIYLFHQVIGRSMHRNGLLLFSDGVFSNTLNVLLLFLPVCILFAILTKKFIEDPFLEMKVKYFK